ncbi:Delta(24)-sterol reductase [Physocladia obscura]|uniref:Delta(24)-sterol reductase n=1 Tax=Physocladia obscura TaxID=109957 RepID=A0AAD5SV51_9FUNG|nr:Delta(24)-sterol reductase [Physocladia obscura]
MTTPTAVPTGSKKNLSVPESRKRQKLPPANSQEKFEDFLLNNRWLAVILLVLPLNYLFTSYWGFRDFLTRTVLAQFRSHEKTVAYIQKQIQTWRESGSKNYLCSRRPGFLQVTLRDGVYKLKDNAIDLPLFDILELNAEKKTVKVEPSVNIGQLTRFLIPKGWCIPVIPEYDDLTMGGMLNGYGIEGSSHKYGLFNDIIVSVDIIVGTGEVVHCSRTENTDLFYALPWSYGGIGFAVMIELEIIPVKKYCRLVYEPIRTVDDMVNRFTELAEATNPPEYLEGIQYDYHNGILTHGDFADIVGNDGVYNAIGNWWKPWFHRHAETLMKKNHPTVEYIPLRDYLHRHTRSLYWEGDLIIPIGNHWLFRHTIGWLMPPSVTFLKLTQTKSQRAHYFHKHIAQDYLLPLTKLKEGLKLCHEVYEVYPLWLCPHALLKTTPQGALRKPINNAKIEQYVDIGIWGVPGAVTRRETYDAHDANREYETWLRENRGYQAMYAISEMTVDEFYKMFDMTLYKNARKKYKSEGVFMDVTEKVLVKKDKSKNFSTLL